MRISKEAANDIAIKMTEKKQKEIKALDKEISDFGYQLAKTTVKKEILEFYEKHKNYFNTKQTLQVSGTGLNFEQISFYPPVPHSDFGGWYIAKLVDDKTAQKIIAMLTKKKTMKEALKSLQTDIKIALLTLGTYAKIQAEFKEAAPYLPVKEKAELAINLQDIKKRL